MRVGKKCYGAGLMLLMLVAGPTLHAATYKVDFTQTDLGDSGPDWFGTFDAPSGGGFLTSFSALIDGTTYSFPQADSFPIFFSVSPAHIGPVGVSFFSELPIPPNATSAAIFLGSDNVWGHGSCDALSCAGESRGTYTISPVPIPAAFPLFAMGIVGLALAAYRRRRKISARSLMKSRLFPGSR